MVFYNINNNDDGNTTLTSTPPKATRTMDILRVNEDDFNFVANSLNLMPSFLSSDLTLAVRLLTVCCLLMALSLLGVLFCGSLLLLMGTTMGFRNFHLDTRVHAMIIAGSGGHTTEVLRLVSGLDRNRYYPRSYVIAESDASSEARIRSFEAGLAAAAAAVGDPPGGNVNSSRGSYQIHKIPRSREVRQSWLTTAFTSLFSLFYSIPLVVNSHPDLVICNGPGTCIPVCFIVRLVRMFRVIETKIIFVESICRVKSLSLSGKILYNLRIADQLVVQWPELKEQYPRTHLLERIV